MDQFEATGRMRVIRTPAGEVELRLRDAWLGLTLPCHPELGYPQGEKGVLSGKQFLRNRSGFTVPQNLAIEVLERERPEAAKGWRALGFPQEGQNFHFAEDEAEIVSGVARQQIIHVEDDMRGDPYR